MISKPVLVLVSTELHEMIGHGRQIVRYKDAAFLRRKRQYFRIIKTTQIQNVGALEIDRRLASADSADNPLTEISVCLKPRFHAWANGSRSRASSSFRLSSG